MDTFKNAAPTEETKSLVSEMIADRMKKSSSEWMSLFRNKINVQWNKTPLGWTFGYLDFDSHPTLKAVYDAVCKADRGVIPICGILAVTGLFQRKRRTPEKMFFHFIFFAFFAVFLLIEVQPRYSYFPGIVLAIAASGGLDAILDKATQV